MRRSVVLGLFLVLLLAGAGIPAPRAAPLATPSPEPLLSTREGAALRVGPATSEHFVGLLANGEGALGVAVSPDGAFLAYTCGMAARFDTWFSGDWYRGRLVADEPAAVSGPDGETLRLSRTTEGGVTGELTAPGRESVSATAAPAAPVDGLFRREDADGVLGAVALPGNTVCAVKRTTDGHLLPAGTVPY